MYLRHLIRFSQLSQQQKRMHPFVVVAKAIEIANRVNPVGSCNAAATTTLLSHQRGLKEEKGNYDVRERRAQALDPKYRKLVNPTTNRAITPVGMMRSLFQNASVTAVLKSHTRAGQATIKGNPLNEKFLDARAGGIENEVLKWCVALVQKVPFRSKVNSRVTTLSTKTKTTSHSSGKKTIVVASSNHSHGN
jgi:hypothetical protein